MRSDLIDIEVIRVHQTPSAILVKVDEDAEGIWVPLSKCEFEWKEGSIGVLTLKEGDAIERGLI